MGEINRDHQERMLRLIESGKFKAVRVSTKKAADTYVEGSEEWGIDYADLICCVPDRRTDFSTAAR